MNNKLTRNCYVNVIHCYCSHFPHQRKYLLGGALEPSLGHSSGGATLASGLGGRGEREDVPGVEQPPDDEEPGCPLRGQLGPARARCSSRTEGSSRDEGGGSAIKTEFLTF